MQYWTQVWQQMTPAQRQRVVLLLFLVLGGMGALLYWLQRPDYRILYSDLSSDDAGKIAEWLQGNSHPYRLANAGTAIEVDQSHVYDLRLQLAQEGLPRSVSGVGFELFDNKGLPGSEFSNEVSFQRALQGELERTISSLDKVRAARVHLVLPKYDLYGGPQSASASVMVQTQSGQQLSAAEVEGLVNLVARAVRGLDPTGVAILDEHGQILSGGTSTGRLSLAQREAQREYEGQLQRSLQFMLDRTVGENRAVVQVQAELDFDEQRIHTESLVPPGKGNLTEEALSREAYAGRSPVSGGTAGISGNLGPSAGTMSGESGGNYDSSQQSRKFAYGREERELIKAPGQVRRLTIAAVLDSELSPGADRQVSDLLKAAAGLKEDRGDQIVVQRMDLAAKQQAEDAEKAAKVQQATQQRGALMAALSRYGVMAFLALVIGGALLSAARSVKSLAPPSAPAPAGAAPAAPGGAAAAGSVVDGAQTASESGALEQSLGQVATDNPRLFAEELSRMLKPES